MLMTRSLAVFGAMLSLAAFVAGLSVTAGTPQVLPRPGVDVRPQDSRIVEPLPLPVSGTLQVTAASTLPVQIVGADGAPLRVQVVNPPPVAPGVPVEQGRCHRIELEGDPESQALSRVEEVRGAWVKVRLTKPGGARARAISWVNTARALRFSEAVACE